MSLWCGWVGDTVHTTDATRGTLRGRRARPETDLDDGEDVVLAVGREPRLEEDDAEGPA